MHELVSREQALANDQPSWGKYAGLGIEFITAVGVGIALGALLDRWLGTLPWFLIVGAALGFFTGLYLMIKVARQVFRD
jgi:ATP synthase protein I